VRIGREGDFFTSANMHPAFGAMLARQVREMWDAMGRPEPFYVIECGPGTGLLCADFLDALSISPSPDDAQFHAALKYLLIEISPTLKLLQEERLMPRWSHKIGWAESLQDLIAQDLISQDLISQELIAQDLIAQDLISQDLISQDLISQELIAQDLISQDMIVPESIERDSIERAGPGANGGAANADSGAKCGIRGCVLSNELLDAFPVHMIEMQAEGNAVRPMEVFVDSTPEGFKEALFPADAPLVDYLNEFAPNLPAGYKTEINLAARKWLADAAALLHEGFILTIDYGYAAWEYYAPERTCGTLMCYCGHKAIQDPYADVGGRDITAHVNFSALKRWGDALGLQTPGYCTQGVFLVSMGIEDALPDTISDDDYLQQAAKIKRLILPGSLGDHKVMVQYKGGGKPHSTPGAERPDSQERQGAAPALRGFSLGNRVGRL
jgi:SAM-dependent MidA family methyltransferase